MREWETVETRELFNGLECDLSLTLNCENPNNVFGIWERAGGHDAGRTVKDAFAGSGHWVHVDTGYTPATLAADFAAQGRENPSAQAYDSLQRELHHHLYGEMLTVRATVLLDGVVLAEDAIGFDYSDWMDPGMDVYEAAKEHAREHFDWPTLIREARNHAREKADKFAAVG